MLIYIRKIADVYRLSLAVKKSSGGLLAFFVKVLRVLKNEGHSGIRLRILSLNRRLVVGFGQQECGADTDIVSSKKPLTPYYLDPLLNECEPVAVGDVAIAVHFYLQDFELLDQLVSRICLLNFPCDIFISLAKGGENDAAAVRENAIQQAIPRSGKVHIEEVEAYESHLSVLGHRFGDCLGHYEFIGSFDIEPANKISVHTVADELDVLIGSIGSKGGRASRIINLLIDGVGLVCAEADFDPFDDVAKYPDVSEGLLEQCSASSRNRFHSMEYRSGSMFWGRTDAISEYMSLKLSHIDCNNDELLRRVFYSCSGASRERYCVQSTDSIKDFRHYEKQVDYSKSIIDSISDCC